MLTRVTLLGPSRRKYKYFIFLNSSVRGPFMPAYMPDNWQWTRAYTDRLVGDVRAVSSSLVCLPEVDAGAATRKHLSCQCQKPSPMAGPPAVSIQAVPERVS
jgi:hypothetical protein